MEGAPRAAQSKSNLEEKKGVMDHLRAKAKLLTLVGALTTFSAQAKSEGPASLGAIIEDEDVELDPQPEFGPHEKTMDFIERIDKLQDDARIEDMVRIYLGIHPDITLEDLHTCLHTYLSDRAAHDLKTQIFIHTPRPPETEQKVEKRKVLDLESEEARRLHSSKGLWAIESMYYQRRGETMRREVNDE